MFRHPLNATKKITKDIRITIIKIIYNRKKLKQNNIYNQRFFRVFFFIKFY